MRMSLCLAFVALTATTATADQYTIDPLHSSVTFTIEHLGISLVAGRFDDFAGSFSYDPTDVASATVEATIQVSSIDTAIADRDAHLRSEDFFHADEFPTMRFESARIEDLPGPAARIHGTLTLHGVTKPVVLEATENGTVTDPRGVQRAGFTARTTIDRQDYGISKNSVLDNGKLSLANEVAIALYIQGIKQVP